MIIVLFWLIRTLSEPYFSPSSCCFSHRVYSEHYSIIEHTIILVNGWETPRSPPQSDHACFFRQHLRPSIHPPSLLLRWSPFFSFEPVCAYLIHFQHPPSKLITDKLQVCTGCIIVCTDPQIKIVAQVEPAPSRLSVVAESQQKREKKATLEESTKPRLVSTVDSLTLTDRSAFLLF